MTTMTKAAILGGAGYAGGELCRLLLGHPMIGAIIPTSRGAERLERVHPNLLGSGLTFVDPDELQNRDIDILFSCTPAGEAMDLVGGYLDRGVRVVDLSADFRFSDPLRYAAAYGRAHTAPERLPSAVYGVTEFNRDAIAEAKLVANPGCYVITALLGLAPLMRLEGVVKAAPLHITAINGTSGAGTTPSVETSHGKSFGSMLPYSLQGHRHATEIEDQLSLLAGSSVAVDLNTAHGNFVRGIYIQASVPVDPVLLGRFDRETLLAVYTDYYRDSYFVRINTEPSRGTRTDKDYRRYPSVAGVAGSNFCHIGLDFDVRRGMIKVVAVTDNLVKGAAGSAVQNMNVMLGYEESLALGAYGL